MVEERTGRRYYVIETAGDVAGVKSRHRNAHAPHAEEVIDGGRCAESGARWIEGSCGLAAGRQDVGFEGRGRSGRNREECESDDGQERPPAPVARGRGNVGRQTSLETSDRASWRRNEEREPRHVFPPADYSLVSIIRRALHPIKEGCGPVKASRATVDSSVAGSPAVRRFIGTPAELHNRLPAGLSAASPAVAHSRERTTLDYSMDTVNGILWVATDRVSTHRRPRASRRKAKRTRLRSAGTTKNSMA